ncbi:MoxR family ATPase [Myxococcota bacterium]|nr:MoxR family ATPase [Myxococcota bacterium]MBU1430995.1 MoxR family ATPase [Myxococcota bacterium]MBU1900528.1 MoxR family ATPase [Myxococcota bacterium]
MTHPPFDPAEVAAAREALLAQVSQRIVGQRAVVEQLLIALFAQGHCLFVGVPGLAKTLLVRTVAEALNLDFNRIQFTPDLMPSDITGTDILEEDKATGRRAFKFARGPIFTHLLLADEINRTPPKTQAALLQAMQEGRVTAAGQTYPLDAPFLVFATQNPIEQEGTYPLPEAQLDRFMFMIEVGYPSAAEELEIVRRTTGAPPPPLTPILDAAQILKLQAHALEILVSDTVMDYAVRLARATRPEDPSAPQIVKDYVRWGAGPRASQHLILAGKARALLNGQLHVSRDDIRALAAPTLRHRVVTNYHAEAEGKTNGAIIEALLQAVPLDAPRRS